MFVIPKPLAIDDLEKLLIDFGVVDGVAGARKSRSVSGPTTKTKNRIGR